MKDYLIQIPQGASAHIIINSSTDKPGIQGLYTNNFSCCNIIVCINKNKLSLIHADMRINPPDIKEHIDWMGANTQTIIIFCPSGLNLMKVLQSNFTKSLPEHKFKYQQIEEGDNGIIVSVLSDQKNFIHPQIKLLKGITPQNLLCHPQEERIDAIRKIGQVIDTYDTSLFRKDKLLFDGQFWLPIELKVDENYSSTKYVLSLFKKEDSYRLIVSKLMAFLKTNQEQGKAVILGDMLEIAAAIGFYLEGYLNNFNAEAIFSNNFEYAFKELSFDPISDDDKSLKTNINLLLKERAALKQFDTLITDYIKKTPKTSFKIDVCDEFETLKRHYSLRNFYSVCESERKQRLVVLNKKFPHAMRCFKEENYKGASQLFRDLIKEATFSCLANDEMLPLLYYNCGRSYYFADRASEAIFFLETALELRTRFVVSPQEKINKIKAALQDCRRKLEEVKSVDKSIIAISPSS